MTRCRHLSAHGGGRGRGARGHVTRIRPRPPKGFQPPLLWILASLEVPLQCLPTV